MTDPTPAAHHRGRHLGGRARRGPRVALGIAGVALVSLAMVTATAVGAGAAARPPKAAVVRVNGEALPSADGGLDTAAAGTPVPELRGRNYQGKRITIGDDGTAKLIVFLAHWCPHCQRDVAALQRWVDDGYDLPPGVQYYSVSTRENRDAPNWPVTKWLKRWPMPVLRDSARGDAAMAYGLTATPMWVLVDAEGNLVARYSGELGVEGIAELLQRFGYMPRPGTPTTRP